MRVPAVFVCCLLLVFLWALPSRGGAQDTLKIGLLISESGSMANSERAVLQASLLAIEEINALGGIYVGQERHLKLEPVVGDGASQPEVFAREVRKLMEEQDIRLFFGCWTSDSRQAVVREIESKGALLFYPVQFEGLETSKSVVYSGITANQQLFPALDYLIAHGARSIYLVGSDYHYPRVSNALARTYLKRRGIHVAGEEYRPRGYTDFRKIVESIRLSKCDAVLNTVNGDSINAFFSEYHRQNLNPQRQPVMSMSLGEPRAARLGPLVAGHLTCWGYFMGLENTANQRFVHAYKRKYGQNAIVDDPGETAYWQVHAFALAAHRSGSTEPPAIRKQLEAMIIDTPGGLVRYDPRNLYTWRTVRIGRADATGRMQVVWSSEIPRKPEPRPR
jgi:urea transport system substrate-binding protein